MKIIIEPIDPNANITRVAHGEYTFDLAGKKPPYEVDADEYDKYIARTGLFRIVAASKKPA